MLFEPARLVLPTSTGCSACEPVTWNQVEAPASLIPLDGKIRQVLAKEHQSPEELARAIGESVDAVRPALRRLARAGRVYNLGFKECPSYTWRIGNHASTAELRDEVLRLISELPLSVLELHAATGADLVRVGRVVQALRRDPEYRNRIVDMGDGKQASWFLPPKGYGPRNRHPNPADDFDEPDCPGSMSLDEGATDLVIEMLDEARVNLDQRRQRGQRGARARRAR